jgi:hypothetical protein
VYADSSINFQSLNDKITETYIQLTDEQIKTATNKEFMRRTESFSVHTEQHFLQFIQTIN